MHSLSLLQTPRLPPREPRMTQDIASLQTLVLNADYRPLSYFPLSIVSWQDAIKAIVLGRVEVISEYDAQVHSPSVAINIPSVISLRRYIKGGMRNPALTRHNILLRDLFQCQYCGERFSQRSLTLDHVMPRSAGGDTSWENLTAACHPCNTQKGDKLPGKGWRHPMHTPRRPSAKDLKECSRIVKAYNFHESWEDYL